MSLASRKLIQATAGATTVDTGDDDFANVVLLLDGDGTGDDNNNTFTDSSTNGFTFTESGSVVQGSFSPYGDNWSNSFGSNNYYTAASDASFNLGTGDFTVEAWVNPTQYTTFNYICTMFATGGLAFYVTGGTLKVRRYFVADVLSSSTIPEIGEWTHVAATRSGTTLRIFVNGVQTATTTDSTNYAQGNFAVGNDSTNQAPWYGNISNLRVLKGTALYTSNFTPPTSPLTNITNTSILTAQSNRFVDNSSNSHALTINNTPKVTPFSPFKDSDARDITTDGGSGYFGGSDYLIKTSGVPTIGTSDFTVECWFYSNNVSAGFRCLYDGREIAPDGVGIFQNGSDIEVWTGSKQIDVNVITPNEWTHLALVRNSGSMQLYINGSASGSAVSFTTNCTSDERIIGDNTVNSGYYFQGYISDLRETHSAVYTSAFTPPTAPLTAITNTELLLNFQDSGIYDRAGINNLDTVGNARLGFAPIYGTGSLAFDGTDDAIENLNADVVIGSGDFTVEAWINFNSTNQDCIISTRLSAGTSNGFLFTAYLNKVQLFSGGSFILTGTTTLTTGQWYHVALTREGSTLRLFVDGSLEDSTTNSTNYSDTYLRVGRDVNSLYDFSGYMDDVRITKGVARYTSNFTPPTEIDLSTDTHREYVTFFLDGDGTVNGQNNTFTDSSTNDFTVTESGSVVQGVFSPYGDNWSNYFNGSSTLQTASAGDTDFDFSTGEFTVECFVNFSSVGNNGFFGCYNTTGWYFQIYAGQLEFANGASAIIEENWSPSTGVWYHIACSRDSSGDVRLFVDGTQLGSAVNYTSSLPATYNLVVGSIGNFSRNFDGYLSSVRIVKGTAVYTSNFTAPTSPLTAITNTTFLSSQSNRFIDNSSSSNTISVGAGTPEVTRFSPFESDKPYDITTDGGSAYFAGASEYLTASPTAPGTGDFCYECWINVPQGSDDAVWETRNVNNSATGFTMTVIDADTIRIYSNNAKITANGLSYLNQWTHLCVEKVGSTTTMYINGTSYGTTTDFTNMSDTNFRVGDSQFYGAFSGYIADFRYVRGAYVYNGNFTPPTAPLTAIANTEVLLGFQDSAIPDLSGINNIDTVGNAKVGGTDPTKYGSNAMQFDGSGDYLKGIASADELNMGTGDWTIEGWYYVRTRTTAYPLIIGNNAATYASGGLAITHSNNDLGGVNHDKLTFANYDDSAQPNRLLVANSAHNLNQWYHFALVRNGTTITMYRDGVSVASKTVPSTLAYNWGDNGILLGGGNWDGAGSSSDALYDDIRVTKGVARYTANFTPPTDALPKF